jgi:hypothetical protein
VGQRGDGEHQNEACSAIASTVGGIMTQDVGAVTGDLELATYSRSDGVEVAVRYAEADEWYTVEGSPIERGKTGGLSPTELHELHEHIVGHLTSSGAIVEGNEQPTSLLGFSR